jgi:hypothetical protein
VDGEELAGARRLSFSPIAYSDQTVIEDMGGEARKFDLTAYVAGEVAESPAHTRARIETLIPTGSQCCSRVARSHTGADRNLDRDQRPLRTNRHSGFPNHLESDS